MGDQLTKVSEHGGGTLYEANTFVVPVLRGTNREMGAQYGALMVDHMQRTWDVIAQPDRDSGVMTDDDMAKWTNRAMSALSTRNREFLLGVSEGSGWPINKVGMLDQMMEFGYYQSKIHAFAGCTSIASWGAHSVDGGVYVGRNMDWTPAFNEFAQVLTVRSPTDGSYRTAVVGWPGMTGAMSAINEHGAYIDLHDGTSMGGSIVYMGRPPIVNVYLDFLAETATLEGLVTRINGTAQSTSTIVTVADETRAVSMECTSLGGNRLRDPGENSLVVVNSFLDADWGLGVRETVSNSLRRFSNMTDRLAEHPGTVDAETIRNLMDLTLFDADGNFVEGGGATKPTKQDADATNYQTVVDTRRRQLWIKIPSPDHFADWTHFDLPELWS